VGGGAGVGVQAPGVYSSRLSFTPLIDESLKLWVNRDADVLILYLALKKSKKASRGFGIIPFGLDAFDLVAYRNVLRIAAEGVRRFFII
jgi:hypothetical protein